MIGLISTLIGVYDAFDRVTSTIADVHSSIENTVEDMKLRVKDYMYRPVVNNDKLAEITKKCRDRVRKHNLSNSMK